MALTTTLWHFFKTPSPGLINPVNSVVGKTANPLRDKTIARTVGILIFDDAEEVDFVVPWEELTSATNDLPAMAAGATDKLLGMADIAALIETAQAASAKCGPYKKRANA